MQLHSYFDRKLIEEFTIKPEVASLSKEERFQLLNHLFQTEYQGKVVIFKMLEQELFVKTTAIKRKAKISSYE